MKLLPSTEVNLVTQFFSRKPLFESLISECIIFYDHTYVKYELHGIITKEKIKSINRL